MAIIEIKNVSKSFGEKVALENVSLEIPEGKIFGLLGPNGAGKTTLIRIINRITIPKADRCSFRESLSHNQMWKGLAICRRKEAFIVR